ncbi:MAG: hypothetical protein ACYC6C_14130 [Coriobacteriia bacterium]
MSGTTYQITLSSGGDVAVTLTPEDPAEMKAGLDWAELAYKHLDGQGKRDTQVNDDQVQEQQEEETPIYAVHNVPMARVKGKYGYIWSCHERNVDGSFCSYKPEGR